MSKGITFLDETEFLKEDIREWRWQSSDIKTWAKYKLFFHQAHQEYKRAVTTSGKQGYTASVKKIYGVPPFHPEEHHAVIEVIQTIVQVMQAQSYDL